MNLVKTLGGVILHNGTVWDNQHEAQGVSQQVSRTTAGQAVVFHQAIDKGLPINLSASIDAAWFDLASIQSLKQMAQVPGNVVQFVWGTETFNVQFNFASGVPFSFQPIVPEADKFIGTIRLITV